MNQKKLLCIVFILSNIVFLSIAQNTTTTEAPTTTTAAPTTTTAAPTTTTTAPKKGSANSLQANFYITFTLLASSILYASLKHIF